MNSKIEVIRISNLIANEKFKELQALSLKIRSNTVLLDWDNKFNRYTAYDLSPFLALVPEIQKKLNAYGSIPALNFSFCYYSLYTSEGICPPHTDRQECQWTVNWCINQDFSWPFFIEGKEFNLSPNEAIVYRGASLKHWREKNQSNQNCDLCVYCFKEDI